MQTQAELDTGQVEGIEVVILAGTREEHCSRCFQAGTEVVGLQALCHRGTSRNQVQQEAIGRAGSLVPVLQARFQVGRAMPTADHQNQCSLAAQLGLLAALSIPLPSQPPLAWSPRLLHSQSHLQQSILH